LHDEGVPRSEEHLGNRRGIGRSDRVGNRKRLTSVRDDLLGVAAAGLDAHRPVADRPAGHVGTDRRDDSRVLETRDLERVVARVGIHPHPLQDVGAVDGGVLDIDGDLVASGGGSIDLLDRQDLGATMGAKDDSAHLPEPIGSGRWRGGSGIGEPEPRRLTVATS